VSAVETWVNENPEILNEVVFVCFNDENHALYEELLG
jgi:O-acetyl-ADP-ribose deacetylase (regulator of RNase III)